MSSLSADRIDTTLNFAFKTLKNSKASKFKTWVVKIKYHSWQNLVLKSLWFFLSFFIITNVKHELKKKIYFNEFKRGLWISKLVILHLFLKSYCPWVGNGKFKNNKAFIELGSCDNVCCKFELPSMSRSGCYVRLVRLARLARLARLVRLG